VATERGAEELQIKHAKATVLCGLAHPGPREKAIASIHLLLPLPHKNLCSDG
jgi:hypothetical protein